MTWFPLPASANIQCSQRHMKTVASQMLVAIGVDVLPVAMLRSQPARAVAEEDASPAVSVSGCFTEHQHCRPHETSARVLLLSVGYGSEVNH